MLLVTGSTPDTLLRWTNLPFRSTNASFAQKMSPYAPFIRERNSDPTHSSVMWRISISFYSPGQILCPVLIASAATLGVPTFPNQEVWLNHAAIVHQYDLKIQLHRLASIL